MATTTMKAVASYMGPGWTLAVNDLARPDVFSNVPRDFFSKDAAEQWAYRIADTRRCEVKFFPSVLAAIES